MDSLVVQLVQEPFQGCFRVFIGSQGFEEHFRFRLYQRVSVAFQRVPRGFMRVPGVFQAVSEDFRKFQTCSGDVLRAQGDFRSVQEGVRCFIGMITLNTHTFTAMAMWVLPQRILDGLGPFQRCSKEFRWFQWRSGRLTGCIGVPDFFQAISGGFRVVPGPFQDGVKGISEAF